MMKSFSLLLKLLQETGHFSLIYVFDSSHVALSIFLHCFGGGVGEFGTSVVSKTYLSLFSICSWPDFYTGFLFLHIWL